MSDIIIVTRESVIAEERGIYVEHTKADIIFKDFWRSNEQLAALFNVVVFGGKEVIKQMICKLLNISEEEVSKIKDRK